MKTVRRGESEGAKEETGGDGWREGIGRTQQNIDKTICIYIFILIVYLFMERGTGSRHSSIFEMRGLIFH